MNVDTYTTLMAEVMAYLEGELDFARFELLFDRLFSEDLDLDEMTMAEFDAVEAIHDHLSWTTAPEPDPESRSYGYVSVAEFRSWMIEAVKTAPRRMGAP